MEILLERETQKTGGMLCRGSAADRSFKLDTLRLSAVVDFDLMKLFPGAISAYMELHMWLCQSLPLLPTTPEQYHQLFWQVYNNLCTGRYL
jgi:hypothetical protein